MQHEWMLDVLSDLRTYSYNHKLQNLAEHLDDVILVAASNIAPLEARLGDIQTNGQEVRGYDRSAEAS